jgi:hypothetical protein
LFQYSQEFDNGYWLTYLSSISPNTLNAPDGTLTADTLTSSGTGGAIYRVYGTAGTYTTSIFAKAGTTSTITLDWSTSANGRIATFDLTNGTATVVAQYGNGGTVTGGTSSIVSVGNGWYRCIISNITVSSTNAFVITAVGASASSVYLWGAQVEQRSSVTAYTVTTTAAITNYIPVLLTAPVNEARFEHNPVTRESLGLEIEEQRTNLLTYSEQFNDASWGKTASSIATNAVIAPDGTLSADTLIEDATNNQHFISKAAAVSSGSVTMSVYAKAAGRNWIRIQTYSGVFAWFNVSTGALGTVQSGCTASITSVGNGWYRCAATVQYVNQTNYVFLANADGATSYTGDGYSGVHIWGIQLEAASFASSYIPTVASQVTRSADSASMTGTNFSSWYNNAEGTVYAEYNALAINSNTVNGSFVYSINDGTFSSYLGIQILNAGTTRVLSSPLASSSPATTTIPAKAVAAYLKSNYGAAYNGSLVSITSPSNVTTPNKFTIGDIGGAGAYAYNGTIKKIAYYPIRVTNTNLQSLTGS